MARQGELSEARRSVCLTRRQEEILTCGASFYRIGFSEFLRRWLDQTLPGTTAGITTSVVVTTMRAM